jgi:uncharacterized protein YlxP (DUF503 family)
MVVGVLRVSLSIPAAASLKAKRQVLRKVLERVKARFEVAIAEVGDNDLWQRAQVGIVAVGNDRRHVNEVLDKVLHFIDQLYLAPILGQELEILSYGADNFGSLGPKESLSLAQIEDASSENADEGDLP